MPVSIVANTIPMPDQKDAIQRVVVEGIGQRPTGEDWRVWITEPASRPDYIITIEGPSNFRWKRDFFGPDEQTPEFIRKAVIEGMQGPPPVDPNPILERLLLRSREGKVPWNKGRASGRFISVFEVAPSRSYAFEVEKVDGTYTLRMKDREGDEILSVTAEEQILFGRYEGQERFERLRDVYELARRKALDVDQKLADVADLLERI